MKNILKLVVLIIVCTCWIGTTVFATDITYESIEGGDIDLDGDGDNDGESSGIEDEDENDDESTNIEGEDGDTIEDEKSVAGGTKSPQTNASIVPIVAMAGLMAAGTAVGLKKR